MKNNQITNILMIAPLRFLAVAAIISLSIYMTGCSGPLPVGAVKVVDRAERDYQEGNYLSSVNSLNDIVRGFPDCIGIGRAHYIRGKSLWKLNDIKGAKEDFLRAVEVANDKAVRVNSLLALGDLAWKADDIEQACTYYTQAAGLIPRGVHPGDHANYMLGCVLQRQGKWIQADERFYYVFEYFSDTELARRASMRINGRKWTVQAELFSDKAQADILAQKLKGKGFDAESVVLLNGRTPVFVVFVGRYETYQQAKAMLVKVKPICHRSCVAVR